MGQGVVWYSGQFHALFFLTSTLKVDGSTASILIASALLLGTPSFILLGTLSDKIGRKPIIMAGCCYFQGSPVAREVDFTSGCDIAKRALTGSSASYSNEPLPW